MIDIKNFREYISELVYNANQELDNKIDNVVLAVNESHMTKKLQGKSGVCLCVSFPDAQAIGQDDNTNDSQQVFLFVCQRVAPGQLNEEEELLLYSILQHIMLTLRVYIRLYNDACVDILPDESYKIEWEYQIFGGMNGLSMGLKFKNYD
jgi:hypothetical protein